MNSSRKRKSVRISVVILVDIYSTESSIPKGRGCVVDLSTGGMAIESEVNLFLETEIFLKIKLDPEVFSFYGKVIRKQDMGTLKHYGIRYTRMGFFERLHFKKYIKQWIKNRQTKTQ